MFEPGPRRSLTSPHRHRPARYSKDLRATVDAARLSVELARPKGHLPAHECGRQVLKADGVDVLSLPRRI